MSKLLNKYSEMQKRQIKQTSVNIGGLQALPEDLKDKSTAAMLVDGTKENLCFQ